MSESIVTLVEKIKTDGVESGKRAAEEILNKTREKAEKILADTEAQAATIVTAAQAQAQAIARQQEHELQLASRDAVLAVRETIVRTVQSVLARETSNALADRKLLAVLIRDMLIEYAHQDARQINPITLNVNEKALADVSDWLLSRKTDGEQDLISDVNLQANLRKLGFEFTINEATVEVTVESIAEVLGQLVSSKVREILDAG
jgi:vacuolar-type H+-ATPase subunit E/Vma4